MTQGSDSAPGRLSSHVVRSMRGLDLAEVRKWAKHGGQRLIEVDLAGCVDKPAVLRAIAQAFALPSWFGMNLDALYDSLSELREQAPAEGYVVLLDRLPRTALFEAEQRAALLDVFRDVVDAFAEAGIPFRVLYS
ncbi:MAG TPA: barstar family protein [Burkholderiaceae bacterium]|nr:barstar family protein [Burkholderiaceae bacterium]